MNLKDCESRFGFATDFVHEFVCVSLPDENNKCFGIEVGPTDSVPISSTLYVLYLNKDNDSIIDKFEEYTNSKEGKIMTTFTAHKYGMDTEDIIDLFTTSNFNEAINAAEEGEYDEVVNDETGEVIWRKGIINMTNITIYDRIELGDIFHNDNGTDYTILAFNKEADIALLLNPKNKFTPYVGANGLRDGHWCHGHYFQTIQGASEWYNSIIDGTY